MSDEYTPDAEAVREAYLQFMYEPYDPDNTWERHAAAFDRWLAAHDREVAAKARASVLDNIEWLMRARNEYTDERVQEHMHVVGNLIRVLKGDSYAAAGWLPSWRWDEWDAIREEPS